MSKEMIYFCQGCSAVLHHRINYCPYCGDSQSYEDKCEDCGTAITEDDERCPECYEPIYTDEDKTRYCSWCGYNLDTDGRNLNLKYCGGVDCGKEIGGLIRYSEETGEQLTVDEIIKINDYNKEMKDWVSGLFHFDNYYYRMLYIYDKTNKYKSKDFVNDFSSIFEGISLFDLNDFSLLSKEENYQKLMVENKYTSCRNNIHCICAIDIGKYSEKIEAHDIIEYCKDIYYRGRNEYDYSDIVRKFDVAFVFVSSVLPEQAKIGYFIDKHFLLITPEKLKSIDIKKIWQDFKEKK